MNRPSTPDFSSHPTVHGYDRSSIDPPRLPPLWVVPVIGNTMLTNTMVFQTNNLSFQHRFVVPDIDLCSIPNFMGAVPTPTPVKVRIKRIRKKSIHKSIIAKSRIRSHNGRFIKSSVTFKSQQHN
jgi:hypothetical protein